jgi:hypothetical protein
VRQPRTILRWPRHGSRSGAKQPAAAAQPPVAAKVRRASGPGEERLRADMELSTFMTSREAAERGEELQPLGSATLRMQVVC